MKRVFLLVVVGVMGVVPGLAQAGAQSDSETLRALLVEVRSLHNDVRLSQTTQILLTELQVQQTVVNRVSQRRDDVHSRVTQVQASEKNLIEQVAHSEETLNSSTDPQVKQQMTAIIERGKTVLPGLKTQEQDTVNQLQDAETAVRREQEKLADIQGQLDAVVKKLQPAVNP